MAALALIFLMPAMNSGRPIACGCSCIQASIQCGGQSWPEFLHADQQALLLCAHMD